MKIFKLEKKELKNLSQKDSELAVGFTPNVAGGCQHGDSSGGSHVSVPCITGDRGEPGAPGARGIPGQPG